MASVKLTGLARIVPERTKVMAKVVIVLAAVLQLADALTEPDCPVMQGATLQNHISLQTTCQYCEELNNINIAFLYSSS